MQLHIVRFTAAEMMCPVTGIPCVQHIPRHERVSLVQDMEICNIDCAHHWAFKHGQEVYSEDRIVGDDLFGRREGFRYFTRRPNVPKTAGDSDKAWSARFSELEHAYKMWLKSKKKPPE